MVCPMPEPFGALCHANLLHNNEVRNVTNQNTRQHRDKVLRSPLPLLLFIILIFFGAETYAISRAFVSRNGIETFALLLPRTCVDCPR